MIASHIMKKKISSENTDLGFQIAPMIDVVFVIMLFFMVMASTIKTEKHLTTALPRSGDTTGGFCDETIISISEDGYISINQEELAVPGDTKLDGLTVLLDKLQKYNTSAGAKTLVTIQTENETRYQRIIDVLNAVSKAHVQNVTFTVGEES